MDDALEIGLKIAAAFERHGVPYALGGALAFGAAGLPRGTLDVDVNVFLAPAELGPVVEALTELGASVDPVAAQREAELEGMFQTRVEGLRVDVFVPSIDFSWEALRTRVRLEFSGRAAWYLSAEALAVFKLLFFRGKDVVDLERLVALQGQRLQLGWIRRELVAMMGEHDERVATWDRIVREFAD